MLTLSLKKGFVNTRKNTRNMARKYGSQNVLKGLGLVTKNAPLGWDRPGLCLYQATFLFIDVSVIGLSETRYHTIVKICRQSGEFTGVDFSRDKASVTARLIPMNYVHV